MALHVNTIKDISDRPWYAGSAADYRAEVVSLAERVLTWHGAEEETRFISVQRHEAAEALGYPGTHAQLAGDAYFHLRDNGLVKVEKTGPGKTDFHWVLTEKGMGATRALYLQGDGS